MKEHKVITDIIETLRNLHGAEEVKVEIVLWDEV